MTAEQSHRLGFLDLVTEHFSFLAHRGFRQNDLVNGGVSYESPHVWILIRHGRLDYALEIELGRRDAPDAFFTLHEVVEALCPGREAEARYQASSRESLAKGVEQFANLLKECAAPLLDGDDCSFQEVALVAQRMRRTTTLDAQYGAIRERANRAWDEKKLQEAFRLYTEMHEALTEFEKRRLSYLAQKLGQSS